MKFFDRENEIAELRRIREASQGTARFTVLTGRRRSALCLFLCFAQDAGELVSGVSGNC